MRLGDWLIYCLAGKEDTILEKYASGIVPGKNGNGTFTSGYPSKCLGGREYPCQHNNMEVDKKVKIFVSYINTHQKICTMKEALKNQFGKLTQPLT